MRDLDSSAARPRQTSWRIPSLVASAILLGPASAIACPSCFASTSKELLHTYYLSAVFLTLMPFLMLGALGAWIANHGRRQRIDVGAPGDVTPRSAR